MQIRFCYAPHAWLNYRQNIIFDFTFFKIVGIFLILYNFPIKILRRYNILLFPLSGIFATVPDSLKSFQNSFFHYISVFVIMHISKRRKQTFPVFFSDSFSAFFYIRQNAYIFADCKRLRKQDKIGNDFSGFSKCFDLMS